ncbi:uncharacterized protein V1518DRAFT_430845 [Limtongia smithiae]|uniref:uncharacterized protein n=1 Tax=Limtongia smithiae TaxID=1125753 RepID=UPI0034CD2364
MRRSGDDGVEEVLLGLAYERPQVHEKIRPQQARPFQLEYDQLVEQQRPQLLSRYPQDQNQNSQQCLYEQYQNLELQQLEQQDHWQLFQEQEQRRQNSSPSQDTMTSPSFSTVGDFSELDFIQILPEVSDDAGSYSLVEAVENFDPDGCTEHEHEDMIFVSKRAGRLAWEDSNGLDMICSSEDADAIPLFYGEAMISNVDAEDDWGTRPLFPLNFAVETCSVHPSPEDNAEDDRPQWFMEEMERQFKK